MDAGEPAPLSGAGLLWSDAILGEARAIHERVESRLTDLGIPGLLEPTGATCMPGVLTKGDVDLHLRAPGREMFLVAVERLRELYRPASPDAWVETLAVFDVPDIRPTGLAVTPVGSEHDLRFRRCWTRLREEPQLLGEYNELKRAAFGDRSYEELKAAFFTRIAR